MNRNEAVEDFPPLGEHPNQVAPNNQIDTYQMKSLLGGSAAGRNSKLLYSGHGLTKLQDDHSAGLNHTLSRLNDVSIPHNSNKKFADMTEFERWTFPGLGAAFEARRLIENGSQPQEVLPNSLQNAVLFGQDLNALGLDFDSVELMYGTFVPYPSLKTSTSQFDFHDRHVVPEFALPTAYIVSNVPPLSSRLNAFSDETLFAVFYQYPRDILQELAAIELTVRDWRWHKVLRQWLQKDSREPSLGSGLPIVDMASSAPVGVSPMRLSERTERGVYVFFDPLNWRRERREFVLDYEQLDHRHSAPASIENAAQPIASSTLPAIATAVAGFPVTAATQRQGLST